MLQILAVMDIRRTNTGSNGGPASPRGGKRGRSYHDLTAMRNASNPVSPAIVSPRDEYMRLPEGDDSDVPSLKMRKAPGEGEVETAAEGLGLDKGDGTSHTREKSD